MAAAFQSDVGLENDPIEPDRTSYAWYTVTDITPPRDRTLGEVHDRVVAAWKDDQRQQKLDRRSPTRPRAASPAAAAIATVAADLSLTVQTADHLTRRTQAFRRSVGGRDPGRLHRAQGQRRGRRRRPADDPRGLSSSTTSPTPPYFSGAPELAQAQAQLSSQIENDLLALYGAQLRSHTEVRLNQAVLQQALGVSPN